MTIEQHLNWYRRANIKHELLFNFLTRNLWAVICNARLPNYRTYGHDQHISVRPIRWLHNDGRCTSWIRWMLSVLVRPRAENKTPHDACLSDAPLRRWRRYLAMTLPYANLLRYVNGDVTLCSSMLILTRLQFLYYVWHLDV